jgi:hypothetical protein
MNIFSVPKFNMGTTAVASFDGKGGHVNTCGSERSFDLVSLLWSRNSFVGNNYFVLDVSQRCRLIILLFIESNGIKGLL